MVDDMGKYYLAHHGVKGMKWGVRHASAEKVTRAANRYTFHPSRRNSRKLRKAARRFEQKEQIQMIDNPDIFESFARGRKLAKYYGLKYENVKVAAKYLKGIAKDAYKPILDDPQYANRGETFLGRFLDSALTTKKKTDSEKETDEED